MKCKSLVAVALFIVGGCSADESVQSTTRSLEDVASIEQLDNGTYLATCVDGTREVITQEQIIAEDVCNSASDPMPQPDPDTSVFNEAICSGSQLNDQDLKDAIGFPVQFRKRIANYEMYGRAKLCYPDEGDVCTPWSSQGFSQLPSDVNSSLFKLHAFVRQGDGSWRTWHPVPSSGGLTVEFSDNRIKFHLGTDWDAPKEFRNGSFPNTNGGRDEDIKITNSCIWATASTSVSGEDVWSNNIKLIQEVVYYGDRVSD